MSGVERDYLDSYLADKKSKTDPNSKDDDFFVNFCISQILKSKDLDIDELESGYTGGDNDGGIDGIYFFVSGKFITEDADPSEFKDYDVIAMTLHIIQGTRSPHFTEEQIRKFEDTCKDLLDTTKDIDAKPEKYNLDVRNSLRRFREWWGALKMKLPTLSIAFHVASKGDQVHINVENRANGLVSVIKDIYPCECEVNFYNAKRLLEMAKKSRRDPVELKFVTQLASDHWGKAFVCLVKLTDYIEVLRNPGGERREYILEPNVRGYLGSKGVNADIHATLRSKSQQGNEFWWLNNGVTITASKITPEISSLILTNARIVNGLQTSREIYNYFQKHEKSAKCDERHILVKVLEADTKAARKITRTTNNQTRIDPIYLRTTTDDIHDNIEAALPHYGFYYERVKNQYYDDDKVSKGAIITLGYLSRALIAIVMEEPHQARGGPAKYVDRHYTKMFNRNSKPEFYGNTVKLMKRVEKFVEENVKARNDRTNLKYYVAFDAACSFAKKSHLQRAVLTNLKLDKLSNELLHRSLARVQKIYRDLIKKRDEAPDVVAKGGHITIGLKGKLRVAYPDKKIKAGGWRRCRGSKVSLPANDGCPRCLAFGHLG